MSYRLKRKRFNCENCHKSWNQLVGQEIETLKCENCMIDCPLDKAFVEMQRIKSDSTAASSSEVPTPTVTRAQRE